MSQQASTQQGDQARPAPRITVLSFDFTTKTLNTISLDDAPATAAAGKFVWIDVDVDDISRAGSWLQELKLLDESRLSETLGADYQGSLQRFDDALYFTLTECRLDGAALAAAPVHVYWQADRLITVHCRARMVARSREACGADFVRYASTPSFLLYELCDHAIQDYVVLQNDFENQVARLQASLTLQVDETVFAAVARVSTQLLTFRKTIMPARVLLDDLATRKSELVSQSSQPYLANMVAALDRLLGDLLVDRDILAGALNLQMSMTAHRTNEVVKRLTSFSIVFLPLTFICGVYGMNFKNMPETDWKYSYATFWGFAVVLTAVQVWVLRRKKLL